MDKNRLKVFVGSSYLELGKSICRELEINLSLTDIYHYGTGCFELALNDNVRGASVFLIQTSLPEEKRLHTDFWELLLMISAAKKASAKEITVVMPYCSYARSDKKWRGRMPIAGKIFTECLEQAGMDRILGVDFHTEQFEGFFSSKTVVDHLQALPLIGQYLKSRGFLRQDSLVLPGDEGFHKKAEKLANYLGLLTGSVEKTRINDEDVEVRAVKGEVKNKKIIIVDDEICTAGTIKELLKKLCSEGAKEIVVAATHGLFQENAFNILSHFLVTEVIVADTVPVNQEAERKLPLKIIPVAPLLASAIKEIYTRGSISKLFEFF